MKWRLVHLLLVFLLSLLFACKPAEEEIEVVAPDGSEVVISGPAAEVKELERQIADLKRWYDKASGAYERHRTSSDPGFSALADIGYEEAIQAAQDVVLVCRRVLSDPKLSKVNGAEQLFKHYQENAETVLSNLGADVK